MRVDWSFEDEAGKIQLISGEALAEAVPPMLRYREMRRFERLLL